MLHLSGISYKIKLWIRLEFFLCQNGKYACAFLLQAINHFNAKTCEKAGGSLKVVRDPNSYIQFCSQFLHSYSVSYQEPTIYFTFF
jgi:hypothetical protein